MCRRLCFLLSIVLFFSIANNSSAQLLARYKFDETSGKTAADSSRHDRNGTLKKDLSFDKD